MSHRLIRSAACLLWACITLSGLTAAPQAAQAQTGSRVADAHKTFPAQSWQVVSSPEKAGWSNEKLAVAHQYADSIHSSAVMIVQGGRVIDEWGDIDKKINGYSMRKSLLSALYGIYAAEGKIDVNETLEQAGIDETNDPLTKEERQARIVDLLRARSGVYHQVDFETALMKRLRPPRGSHAPGTYWYYNNWDFNVLGAIFEKKTGLKMGDAFYQRIAKPIGMQDFQPADVHYFGGPASIYRGYQFEITARDLARFGLLYLNHGRWMGKQIVPEAWVDKSTHAAEGVRAAGVELGGYEYLWWVEYAGVHLPEATLPGMYSARGATGHYLLVVPSKDLVIVHRVDTNPPAWDAASVNETASHEVVSKDQFGHLVRLILDAETAHP
jgi:CubicO group peptidase (beta-lactamase class C family)